jgi:hypothetical protein
MDAIKMMMMMMMIKESLCKKIKCTGVTVVTKYRLSRFILMAEK